MMADETVVGIYSPPSGKNTSSVWECFGHPILTFEVSHFLCFSIMDNACLRETI